jgi:hypothetical protein
MTSGEAPRFIADAMLGRLARWLRYLGFDTTYDAAVDDGELVLRAEREDRVLLTRDRGLLERWRPRRAVFLPNYQPLPQLRFVLQSLGLPPLSEREPRCTVCNGSLSSLHRAEAQGRVPTYVLQTQEVFFHCANCGRIYWQGTHVRRMRADLEHALSSGPPSGPGGPRAGSP